MRVHVTPGSTRDDPSYLCERCEARLTTVRGRLVLSEEVHEPVGYRIDWRWKEEVVYSEDDHGFLLDAGWGAEPPVLYVPAEAIWDDVVPDWLRGRRDLVVDRLRVSSGHVLEDTSAGYAREDDWRRVDPDAGG